MIKDVELGLKILGYCVSVAKGTGLLTLICLAGILLISIWLL
jgi:hypothetical protein